MQKLTGMLSVKAALLLAFAGAITSVNAQEPIIMRNERLSLSLGRAEKGAVVSLIDAATQAEFIAPQKTVTLFALGFSRKAEPNGERFYLSSHDASQFGGALKQEAKKQIATFDYSGFSAWAVEARCTVTMTEGDPLARWRLTVKIPETLMLEEVKYPAVNLRAPLGQDVLDDSAVLGATKGGIIRRPGEMKRGSRVASRQPGNLAAQFGCYYDDRAGFYMAAYDGKGYRKELSLQHGADGIEAAWSQSCMSSGTFALDYDVVMTTFAGADKATPADWRDAADIYKDWALTQPWCATTYDKRVDIPSWMKDGPAMVRFSRGWLSHPERIEKWFAQYWQKYFPKAPLITAFWGWEKVGSWVTPDYFPVYPSDEQFTSLVAHLRKQGCHAFPWPSGYHWTLTYQKQADGKFIWDDRQRFDQIARSHAIINRDGKLYTRQPSWLQGGETSCLCPGDPWTINWWIQEVCVPLLRRGCEMIQVDQVVGGSFPVCYSKSHPHPPGAGLWMTDVFTKQMRTMLQTCRRIEPDAVVCFEEPNEQFNHLAGIQDYRDCEASGEWASVFNYLYHEFLPTFQSNPHGGDLVMAAYCLVNGQMPHLTPSMRVGDGSALLNGGFEEAATASDTSTYSGWDKVPEYQGKVWNGKAARDETERHSGAASLRLDNAAESDIVQVSQNVATDAKAFAVGRKYRLSAWMKTNQMARSNTINLGFMGSSIKFTGAGQLSFPAAGVGAGGGAVGGWVRRSAEFTVPAGASQLRIMIHVSGAAKVWVDDVTLEELRPDGGGAEVRSSPIPLDHELMLKWVSLYHGEGRPYLEFGRMLHPPKLKCATITYRDRPMPAILHNAFRAPDGSEAVILANGSAIKQTAILQWKGKEHTIEMESGAAEMIQR